MSFVGGPVSAWCCSPIRAGRRSFGRCTRVCCREFRDHRLNSDPTRCRLCGSSVVACGEQRMLRYDVTIFLCPECDLLQTQKPHWLDEAYSSALTLLDTGAAQRSQITVGITLGIARILGIR